MFRVYWVNPRGGYAEEQFCTTPDERDDLLEELRRKGINAGWEVYGG